MQLMIISTTQFYSNTQPRKMSNHTRSVEEKDSGRFFWSILVGHIHIHFSFNTTTGPAKKPGVSRGEGSRHGLRSLDHGEWEIVLVIYFISCHMDFLNMCWDYDGLSCFFLCVDQCLVSSKSLGNVNT